MKKNGIVSRTATSLLLGVGLAVFPGQLAGEESSALAERLQRIFAAKEFEPQTFGPAKWVDDGAFYTTLESAAEDGVKEIVRYETATGKREVLVEASRLLPEGETRALVIEDYAWSEDGKRLLIFTNTQRVWRKNTRGDYWLLELESGTLTKLGGEAAPSTLMFAKLSPDGSRVAYVRENNLYVEEIESGKIIALTTDGSDGIVNGTSDWVYEEEFDLRDGFRWSPDGTQIAYWRFDTSGVDKFALINNTDAVYPKITLIPYPKAGTTNSSVRIGVVSAAGGESRWIEVPGDPRDGYIPRMEWAGDSKTLVLQHLNRLQNINEVLLAEASTGRVEVVHRDRSDTWVEVVEELEWLEGSRELIWLSEKNGWRQAYRVRRDGSGEQLITRFDAEVMSIVGLDASGEGLYFIASPDNATQSYLYRSPLDGTAPPRRVTPADEPGTHSYDLSPDGRWAFRTHSRFDQPPIVDLVRLPAHESVRVLVDNAELRQKLADVLVPPVEFFQTEIEEGVFLDSWMLKPRDFDAESRYPVLVYVYGEVAGTTVVDRWGGERMLFHRALADEGFVVVSFDNRSTPAPKGVAWRKAAYGALGDLSSRDQAAAVQELARKRPYVDPTRVAVWGWSGGGSNTLNCLFRFPEVFRVGIAVAPVPDQTLYDTVYQERYMGLPAENPEGYRLGSPIHFAEGLEGRLLLIHGSADDNVHYQGTERLVNRLIELGKPFDMMVYPNRTHSIKEGEGTRLHLYSLIARYLTAARW